MSECYVCGKEAKYCLNNYVICYECAEMLNAKLVKFIETAHILRKNKEKEKAIEEINKMLKKLQENEIEEKKKKID